MKKTLIPIASAMMIFTSLSHADLTIYGKINGSLQMTKESIDTLGVNTTSKDNWELTSNASRIGIKGKTKLSDNGLNVIYKAEYQIAHDDGTADNDEFKARNMYVGLQGAFGTIIAGKHDTPTKLAQGKIDMFNDLVHGDIKNIMVGENREDNIVMYTTPKAAGFYANVAFMPGEDAGCDALACKGDDSDLGDQFSASINYKHDKFWVSLAADNNVRNTDLVRLASQANFGDFTIGALIQTAEVHDDMNKTTGLGKLSGIPNAFGMTIEQQDAAVLSGSVKVNKFKLKAQYGMSTSEDFAGNDYDATQIALGVDYELGKRTKLFTYYSVLDGETDIALLDFDVKYDTLGVGIEHKF